jgi:gluconate kinase
MVLQILNITDRFKKMRRGKKKQKYKKNHFMKTTLIKFSLNYISNPQPEKCILSAHWLNVSNEVKFTESTQYHFEDSKIQNMNLVIFW